MNIHHCIGWLPQYKGLGSCGEAIGHCFEDNDRLFVDNSEYTSQVNYCPYCGYEAKEKVKYIEPTNNYNWDIWPKEEIE